MKHRPRTSILLALCGALGARSAFAEPTPTEIAVGRKLFKEAVALEAAEKWTDAAEKIRAAIAVKDTPGLRFHLARCEEEQGNLVEALLEYGRAEDLIRGGADAPDVVPLLAAAREALEKRVPTLRLMLPSDVTAPSVHIDGSPVAPSVLGQAAPVNPGRHRVVVRAPGRQPFERDIVLEVASRAEVEVELPMSPEPAALPAAPVVEPPSPRNVADGQVRAPSSARTLVLASEVGLTVVSLGVGVAFAVLRGSAADRVAAAQVSVDRSSNNDPGACAGSAQLAPESCADLASAVDDRDQASTLMTIGFVGAGVGALATGFTWLLWPAEKDNSQAWRVDAQLTERSAAFRLLRAF